MTEDDRRAFHQLLFKAADGERLSALSIEQKTLDLNTSGSADDVTYILQTLRLHGLDALHQRIAVRLQESQNFWYREWPSNA